MSSKKTDRNLKDWNAIYSRDENLIREKQKARDLKGSAWWRKKRSDGLCHYCGEQFHPRDLTMDHVIPLSRGGRSDRNNIVPACKECNNKKKYLHTTEWDEYLQWLKGKTVDS